MLTTTTMDDSLLQSEWQQLQQPFSLEWSSLDSIVSRPVTLDDSMCRPQLLPNACLNTPWQILYESQSDRAKTGVRLPRTTTILGISITSIIIAQFWVGWAASSTGPWGYLGSWRGDVKHRV